MQPSIVKRTPSVLRNFIPIHSFPKYSIYFISLRLADFLLKNGRKSAAS